MILDVRDLSCGYGKKNILNDINFAVKKGEITGILGPNGSGKTTLIRAITKLIRPASGKILLMGKDISLMSFQEIARKSAVVNQQIDSGWMKVGEYVLMGRIPYFKRYQFFETENDVAIAAKYMAMTGADRLKDKSMLEISGGERQLAVITRALAQEPALLLLDEPTSHLDISHQIGILDLIRRLNSELKITVVMILHDLNFASEYCDNIILMNKGRIFSHGTPDEVLTYKALEEVYNTVVIVEKNPISKKPYVLLVSKNSGKNVSV